MPRVNLTAKKLDSLKPKATRTEYWDTSLPSFGVRITPKGDKTEIDCLKIVFGERDMEQIPISSNKSQVGHTLGGSAAIEAALSIEGMQQKLILPTVNHIPDPEMTGIDVVPNSVPKQSYEFFLSNAFGFGGTNCCIVFRGV